MDRINLLKFQRSFYTKVKTKKSGNYTCLDLPALVGSSPKSDIIINSDVVMPLAKVIYHNGHSLKVLDLKTKSLQNCRSLESYGIYFKGPYDSVNLKRNVFSRFFFELASGEQNWFHSLPLKVQKILGKSMGQRLRLSSWSAIIAIFLLVSLGGNEQVMIDRSNEVINVEYETVFSQSIGAVSNYRDFRHGAQFSVTIPKDKIGLPHVVHMKLQNVDSPAEITAYVGHAKLFESTVDAICVREGCDHEFVVPGVNITTEQLVIKLSHNKAESDYLVSDLLVMPMRPLTDREWFSIRQQYERAKRFFAERLIARENVLMARRELNKIHMFLANRTGSVEFKVQVDSLLEEIDSYIKAETEGVLFEAKKGIKLRRFDEALVKLQLLKEFFVDESHPKYEQLVQLIEYVKEARK